MAVGAQLLLLEKFRAIKYILWRIKKQNGKNERFSIRRIRKRN